MGLAERRAHCEKMATERKRHVVAIYLTSRLGLQLQMSPDMFPPLFRLIRALPPDTEERKGVDSHHRQLRRPSRCGYQDQRCAERGRARRPGARTAQRVLCSTMLALGGTKIVMHPLACLGPIDPQLVFRRPDGTMEVISAEDIKAFVEFIREEVGITHQKEVASVFGRMYDDVKPVQLGVARRASMRFDCSREGTS